MEIITSAYANSDIFEAIASIDIGNVTLDVPITAEKNITRPVPIADAHINQLSNIRLRIRSENRETSVYSTFIPFQSRIHIVGVNKYYFFGLVVHDALHATYCSSL